MEKKFSIEPVSIDVINHSGLANLNLFYSFVHIDGKPYFIRQNNLLAMFFPFLASKLWYRPFEVSEVAFERAKNKRSSTLSMGAASLIGSSFAVLFTSNPRLLAFLYSWQLDFRKVSNGAERITLTFLILLFAFCLSIVALNIFWKILGYIIFKISKFRALTTGEKIKVRKVSYYRGTSQRNLRLVIVWGMWLFVPIICLLLSFILENSVIQPFYDVSVWLGIIIVFSFAPMLTVPNKFEIKVKWNER